MDRMEISDIQELMFESAATCLSLYMPTHPVGAEGEQDAIRLRNLLDRAERTLLDSGMRPASARNLLQPARRLPNDPADWQRRSWGLALFLSPRIFRHFRLPVRLGEFLTVNRRFHIKPVLSRLGAGRQFFVLMLSQNRTHLLTGDESRLETVDVPAMPMSMDETLNYSSTERGSQAHSAMREPLGKQAAVFHSQGGQPDKKKADLKQFFRLVDVALQPVLKDQQVPLLLAGVEYLMPIYREVNSYAHLAEQHLAGNWNHLTLTQLRERSWPLAKAEIEKTRAAQAARLQDVLGTSRTSHEVTAIVPAACQGRVDLLFVDQDSHVWGEFDDSSQETRIHEPREPLDEDLLDRAAVETMLHGGTVYAVEKERMPAGRAIAALFRYERTT